MRLPVVLFFWHNLFLQTLFPLPFLSAMGLNWSSQAISYAAEPPTIYSMISVRFLLSVSWPPFALTQTLYDLRTHFKCLRFLFKSNCFSPPLCIPFPKTLELNFCNNSSSPLGIFPITARLTSPVPILSRKTAVLNPFQFFYFFPISTTPIVIGIHCPLSGIL